MRRQEWSRQREQPMQRPHGWSVPDEFKEKQGGPCGWSRVSKGERWEMKLEIMGKPLPHNEIPYMKSHWLL